MKTLRGKRKYGKRKGSEVEQRCHSAGCITISFLISFTVVSAVLMCGPSDLVADPAARRSLVVASYTRLWLPIQNLMFKPK